MKNFARVMGLLFGSAGAHTYPKYGQTALPLAAGMGLFLIPVHTDSAGDPNKD